MRYLSAITGLLLLTVVAASCTRDNRRPPGPVIREYSFVDDFDNDRNGWGFADGVNVAYGVVSGGTFRFDYLDDYYEAYYVAQDVRFNPYDDFTISARIGSDNNMGLLFGKSGDAYGYTFTVDYDGYYALYDEGGNGYGPDIVELVPPRTNNYVHYNGDWNELTIEQRGARWYGYINGVEVFNIEAQNFRGNQIGFMVVPFTQGEADYIEAFWYR